MVLNEIRPEQNFSPLKYQQNKGIADTGGPKFSDTLNEFLTDVNDLQVESSEKTEALIKGEPVDIHDVMISAQKAKTSFNLLMELRNKGLDLYREVLRLQV